MRTGTLTRRSDGPKMQPMDTNTLVSLKRDAARKYAEIRKGFRALSDAQRTQARIDRNNVVFTWRLIRSELKHG
jgi:hypothetical protein